MVERHPVVVREILRVLGSSFRIYKIWGDLPLDDQRKNYDDSFTNESKFWLFELWKKKGKQELQEV